MSEDVQAFLASKKPEDETKEDYDPEAEEVKGEWTPIVNLPEVEVVTGEENMEPIYIAKAKLYRWADNQWKERGTGKLKLLRDKNTKKVYFIMRQEHTKKIIASFLLEDEPLCALLPHAGNDKAWVWLARDNSDGELMNHRFTLRLANAQIAQAFKEAFEAARQYNHCIKNGEEATPAPVVEDTADP